MNTQRITVSLPTYLYQKLLNSTQKRQISQFVAEAVEEKIIDVEMTTKTDPIIDFLALRKKYAGKNIISIKEAIQKGRL